MEHLHGTFPLSTLVVMFGLRSTETEAKASIRNGVVKINSKPVVNPDAHYSLVRLDEIQCGKHIIQLNRKT